MRDVNVGKRYVRKLWVIPNEDLARLTIVKASLGHQLRATNLGTPLGGERCGRGW